MDRGNNKNEIGKGVNFEIVYDKLYDEILFYVENKSRDFNVITFEDVDIKENYLNNDYVIVDHIEEDKMDEFIEMKNYNHRENTVISFNVPIYLKENLVSYKYDTNTIWDQFDKDYFRNNILVNGKIIKNELQFIKLLKKLQGHFIVIDNDNMLSLTTIIALLCCQSSYAFPYNFLNKIQMKNGTNIIATNSPDNRSIRIDLVNDGIKVWIETDVKLRYIFGEETDTKAHITLTFDVPKIITGKLEEVFKQHGMFFINFYQR